MAWWWHFVIKQWNAQLIFFSGTVLHTVLQLNGCMCSIVLISIFTYGLATAQLGVEYYSNKKGWKTMAVFNTWITNWNCNLRWMQGNHKVVLFVDQASSHVLQDLSNIRIQFLPPNTTSKLQPMDQGVIRSFKCCYRSRLDWKKPCWHHWSSHQHSLRTVFTMLGLSQVLCNQYQSQVQYRNQYKMSFSCSLTWFIVMNDNILV